MGIKVTEMDGVSGQDKFMYTVMLTHTFENAFRAVGCSLVTELFLAHTRP